MDVNTISLHAKVYAMMDNANKHALLKILDVQKIAEKEMLKSDNNYINLKLKLKDQLQKEEDMEHKKLLNKLGQN